MPLEMIQERYNKNVIHQNIYLMLLVRDASFTLQVQTLALVVIECRLLWLALMSIVKSYLTNRSKISRVWKNTMYYLIFYHD